MRTHVINRLTELSENNTDILLLTGDLGFGVLEPFQKKFPDRFFNCGIAEQNMASMAAGLGMEGNTVFVYSIGNFPTLRCLEQIRNDICYHNATVKILAVGGGFSYGKSGMTHHATEDLAVMAALPNMRVYAPADYIEALAVLEYEVKASGPAYIRLAKGRDLVYRKEDSVHSIPGILPFCNEDIPDLTASSAYAVIMTTGTILDEGIKAAAKLNKSGIPTSLFSVPRLKPLDAVSVLRAAHSAKIICTIEEHGIQGGLGSAVSDLLSGEPSHAVLRKFALNNVYSDIVGDQSYLRKAYHLTAEDMIRAITDFRSDPQNPC